MKKKTKAKRAVVTGKSDAANVQLLDYFAAMALSGILANTHVRRSWEDREDGAGKRACIDDWRADVANASYFYADAMLSAREANP